MYYVYIYLDPRRPGKYNYKNVCFNYEPIYVGKGNRITSHIKEVLYNKPLNKLKCKKIRKILNEQLEPIIFIFAQGTEIEMLAIETNLIQDIGRIVNNTGPLTNVYVGVPNATELHHRQEKQCCKQKHKNGKDGKTFQTIYNRLTNESMQIDTQFIQTFIALGWDTNENWNRLRQHNSMSRPGTTNPMYGKSAVKGRKWVTTEHNEVLFLTQDEIADLACSYKFGRKVDRAKKKRVIVKGQRPQYMSAEDIQSLPPGTEYQFGLVWRDTKKTYKIQ